MPKAGITIERRKLVKLGLSTIAYIAALLSVDEGSQNNGKPISWAEFLGLVHWASSRKKLFSSRNDDLFARRVASYARRLSGSPAIEETPRAPKGITGSGLEYAAEFEVRLLRFPDNFVLPTHDHPGLTVVTYVMEGTGSIDQYDLSRFPKVSAMIGLFDGSGVCRGWQLKKCSDDVGQAL